LLEDGLDFGTVKSVLETVTDEDNQRQALTGLVGTGARLGGIRTYTLLLIFLIWNVQNSTLEKKQKKAQL
jgi:hypothetical protein